LSQLLNVHEGKHVKRTEVHRADPFVNELNFFQVEISIKKLDMYKSPDTYKILQN